MAALLTEPYESAIAYAIMIRFLRLIAEQEPVDRDLEQFTRWGELNSAGTMSYDLAYFEDWKRTTAQRGVVTASEAYNAMITLLTEDASRSAGDPFVDRIERLKKRQAFSSLWAAATQLVAEDVEAAEPFRGTWTFGVDADGRRVRVERDPETGQLRSVSSREG